MPKWKYVQDNESMREFMMSQGLRGAVAKVAHEVALEAAATARRSAEDTEHYGDQFHVIRMAGEMTIVDHGHANPRVKVQVVNFDPVSVYNEFGNKRTPRRRTLGLAAQKFGRLGKMGPNAKMKTTIRPLRGPRTPKET